MVRKGKQHLSPSFEFLSPLCDHFSQLIRTKKFYFLAYGPMTSYKNFNWWRLGNLKTKLGNNYIPFYTLTVLSTIAKEIEKLDIIFKTLTTILCAIGGFI